MRRTPGTRRVAVALEHRVLGVTFLSLLALFVWLTYAIFNKTFTDYVDVTLRASRTGLQLPNRADVKVRGMVVGAVVDRKVTTGGAVLTLGLFPGRLALIPANVTARILPKTLFGEKYVALQVPADPAGESIRAGDVIRESKVA
ncbi:MAG TPA: MlaD family protein, partial [Nocardioidaceae bacterium]|nr:MlaD family protein [Nocardioidaceae bacterium]